MYVHRGMILSVIQKIEMLMISIYPRNIYNDNREISVNYFK